MRSTRVCSIDGCSGKHVGNGLCGKHYRRNYRGNSLVNAKDFPLETRFFARVDIKTPDECWEWIPSLRKGKTGIAQVMLDGVIHRTYRLAYKLIVGDIEPGKHILHSCDNQICCNPRHLRAGTHQENMQDKIDRNRQARGETAGPSKLTEEQAKDVFRLKAKGMAAREIADYLGITTGAVYHILTGRSWRHLGLAKKGEQKHERAGN